MSQKALVVDNDFFFVEFLTELLEERGFETVKAYDGKEAMEKLDAGAFDLMFADMVMPKIDGWQLIQHVRKRFGTPSFPIAVVSGTIVEQLEELERIGADFYIVKGPLEKMKQQIGEFLDDLEKRGSGEEPSKHIYNPGDIFPRRESAELIESLRFKEAIFESMGLGLLVVDLDGKIIQANAPALKILDHQPADLVNRLAPSVLAPEHRKTLVEAMKQIVKNSALTRMQCPAAVGGTPIRITVSVFYLDDRPAGWILCLETNDA
jgi:PAS domain S-box-containing protein